MINPNEIYDNLYDGFEKNRPIPLLKCSNYSCLNDFASVTIELLNFKKDFKDVFFSDFTKVDSKKTIKKSLKSYCESVKDEYMHNRKYNQTYSVKDYIWYSLCVKLYFAYKGMISQTIYNYELVAKKNGLVVAKEYALPIL